MYIIKEFKTFQDMKSWIDKNGRVYQYTQIFIANKYALEVRKLKRIY